METKLTCNNKEVIISPERPFTIIGERINPTRRKKLAETMAQGDFSVVLEDARRQIEAGAHVLDVTPASPAPMSRPCCAARTSGNRVRPGSLMH